MNQEDQESINSPLDLFKWDFPNYIDGKHLHVLNKRLMGFADGSIENLALFLPPRHSKSMMASIYLPSYIMLKDGNATIIQAAHSMNLVEQFVSHSRDIIRELSPFPLNESFQRMNEYKYARPYTGHVKGIGVQGGITGFGAKYLLIDDIIKDAESIMSDNLRKKLDDYYTGVLSTRLMPKGQKLLMMTRWGTDDISQTIIEDEGNWEILEMPAICLDEELPIEKELGRKDGDALWPEFWPLPELKKRQKTVGNFWWNAQYLQQPVPVEGNLLNPQGLQYYDRTPNTREFKQRIMTVDPAISESKRADETAVTILDVDAHPEGGIGFYVHKQFAWRRNTDFTQNEVIKLYNYYRPDALYMEAIGFQAVILSNLQKSNIPVMPLIDRRNKEVKIGELAPHLDNGRIFLHYPKEDWTIFESQLAAFPLGKHDDRVESLWMAVKMAEKAINPYTAGDPSKYYEFSRGHKKQEGRPKSVFMDINDNPYSIKRSGW